MCVCEQQAPVGTVTDHGWIANVTPGADSWHKMVQHGKDRCHVLTSVEVEALREKRAHTQGKQQEGVKYDKDKPRYDLIPFKALGDVVEVLTYGAKKYAPENWRLVDGWRWRYFGAAMRHLVAWFGGEKVDPESGYKHLAHAVCCLMFALELDLHKDET